MEKQHELPGRVSNVLVAGWFSFEHGHATAGDVMCAQLVGEWLDQLGHTYEVAFDSPFEGGVDWRLVDPGQYSHVVFVCGPFEQGQYEADFLSRFRTCRLIGLNLSMQVPLPAWNPFDFLLERNSSAAVRPDMVFLSHEPLVPVVGVCLVEPYPAGLDAQANAAIERLIQAKKVAVIAIDTRLDNTGNSLRSAAEVESMIARVDVLVTTRLHGMVMALKNKVPVLAIDPEAGGNKIRRQATKIGWPILFTADALDDAALSKALDYCLTKEGRMEAQVCGKKAIEAAADIREAFMSELTNPRELEVNLKARLANAAALDWISYRIAAHGDKSLGVNWQRRLRTRAKKNTSVYCLLDAAQSRFCLRSNGKKVDAVNGCGGVTCIRKKPESW